MALHIIPRILVFFSIINILIQAYLAYLLFQRYDLYLVNQLRGVASVLTYSIYTLAVWTTRNQWNGDRGIKGWFKTLIFIFVVNYAVYRLVEFLLDNIFGAPLSSS